jgi:preprotein translocase subunit SecD
MQTLKTGLCVTLVTLALTGCALFPKDEKTTVRIHEQVDIALPQESLTRVEIPRANLKLAISPFPILTERDVLSADLYDTVGGKAIFLRFDIHGTMVLDECTTRNRGRYLVTCINNRPVAAWLIDRRIFNGQLLIEGDFTDEEAKRVVDALNKMAKKNRR